jgi:shikimate kinase/3-dehydroquinate synthase
VAALSREERGPQPAIALVGFMGAGKTRAAQGIGAVLGEPVTDVDREIERELGEPIASFFEREGEAAFRSLEERHTLAALERGGVVSLGGGAVENERIRDALRAHFTAWCRVREEVAWERCRMAGDTRPLARDRGEFGARLRRREPLYESVARAVLTDGGERMGRRAAPWLRATASLPGARLAWAASRSGEYPAIVGAGAVGLLGRVRGLGERARRRLPGRWFPVADAAALRAHGGLLDGLEEPIVVEGGERSKTLAEYERVLRELAGRGVRRDDGVVAFGGGVVGDLAGFCAATYQRGVPVVQVPTTVVAQVDSAYGGKTGVDLPEGKNYVGAYHMPLAVLADPATLATLPPEEVAAGFAEVVKTALLAGGELWERVRALDEFRPAELADVIFACARTKLDVVASDERDSGARAALNLGHTVGHAIEAVTGYERYRHGEAVGLGMLAALRLSGAGELRAEVAELLERHGLPVRLDPAIDPDEVVAATARDKKAGARGVGWVLLERPGEVVTGASVDAANVREAVKELQ